MIYLAIIGVAASVFLNAFAIFIIIRLFQAKKLPMDKSNRINHIILFWLVLNRPEIFVEQFKFIKNDVWDNIKKD